MADLVVPPGYAQGLLIWTVAGDSEPMVTTIGLDASEYDGEPDDLAEKLGTSWSTTHPAASFYVGWTFVGARVYMGSDPPPGLVGEDLANIAGTAVGQTPPQNVAVLANKTTAFAGRRNKGRMYFPPSLLSEGAVNQVGVIDGSSVTAIQTGLTNFYNELLDSAPLPPAPPVLFHSTGVTTPTPITSLNVQSRVATQRQRLRR